MLILFTLMEFSKKQVVKDITQYTFISIPHYVFVKWTVISPFFLSELVNFRDLNCGTQVM